MLFALKHSERTLLTKDYEAKSKDLVKGPVVMYVDISGSMAGDSELWSKAMAYVIAEECLKTGREAQINLFDQAIEKTITLKPNDPDNPDLLTFILEWYTQGGTSFDQVMINAYSQAKMNPKADMLLITDGDCEVTDRTVRKFNMYKTEKSFDVHAFCIGVKSKTLLKFCDHVQRVNTDMDADSADLFLSALD